MCSLVDSGAAKSVSRFDQHATARCGLNQEFTGCMRPGSFLRFLMDLDLLQRTEVRGLNSRSRVLDVFPKENGDLPALHAVLGLFRQQRSGPLSVNVRDEFDVCEFERVELRGRKIGGLVGGGTSWLRGPTHRLSVACETPPDSTFGPTLRLALEDKPRHVDPVDAHFRAD